MFSPNISKLLAKVANNWLAKVLSVALAIILFVFHRMGTLGDRFFTVPLKIEMNSALVPASSYPRVIRVNLRGEEANIYSISEEDIEAYIDLKDYDTPGWYRAPVLIRKTGTSLGLEPLEISVDPIEISLELDRKISKYVPLAPNLRGTVQDGHNLISSTLTPAQVVVEGPLSLLESVSELYTDFIDLEGRTDDFSVTVGILNSDPLLLIRGSGMIEFHGFVRRTVPVRNLTGLPITINGLDEAFAAEQEVKTGSVRLEGSQSRLDLFVPPPLFLSVDASEITEPGTYTLPVAVDLPEDFNLLRQDPQETVLAVRPAGDEAP
jgi:YbbR domain-containing protein